MKLYEYMRSRNGLTKDGGIKAALSNHEFNMFNIVNNRGWARKYRNLELDDSLCESLLTKYSKLPSDGFDKQYVYLIYSDTTNKSKIGISSDPKRRKDSLQTSAGMELKLVSVWKVNFKAKEVEKHLHKKYKKIRQLGEWFEGEILPEDIENNIFCEYKRLVS